MIFLLFSHLSRQNIAYVEKSERNDFDAFSGNFPQMHVCKGVSLPQKRDVELCGKCLPKSVLPNFLKTERWTLKLSTFHPQLARPISRKNKKFAGKSFLFPQGKTALFTVIHSPYEYYYDSFYSYSFISFNAHRAQEHLLKTKRSPFHENQF